MNRWRVDERVMVACSSANANNDQATVGSERLGRHACLITWRVWRSFAPMLRW